MLPVRPEPLEAFSALAMTQSMRSCAHQRGERLFQERDAGGADDVAEEEDAHKDPNRLAATRQGSASGETRSPGGSRLNDTRPNGRTPPPASRGPR